MQAAHERAVDRFLRGAVVAQPRAAIVMVDRIEALGREQQPLAQRTAHDREQDVDHLPHTPQLVIGPDRQLQLCACRLLHGFVKTLDPVERKRRKHSQDRLEQPRGFDDS